MVSFVIENANQLTKETVEQLNKAMEFRTDGLIVIIEDEKIGMRKLIARFPKFTSKFTSMINIPVFTNDELVNFAKCTQEKMDIRSIRWACLHCTTLSVQVRRGPADEYRCCQKI